MIVSLGGLGAFGPRVLGTRAQRDEVPPGQGLQYAELHNLGSSMAKRLRHHLPIRFGVIRPTDLGATIRAGEDPGPTRFRHSKPKGTGRPQPLRFRSSWPRWLGILTSEEFRRLQPRGIRHLLPEAQTLQSSRAGPQAPCQPSGPPSPARGGGLAGARRALGSCQLSLGTQPEPPGVITGPYPAVHSHVCPFSPGIDPLPACRTPPTP